LEHLEHGTKRCLQKGQISPQTHRTGKLSRWDNCSKTSLLIVRGLVEKVVLANNSYLSIIHPCHILYPYYITHIYIHIYIYIILIIFIPFNSIPLIGSGDDRWLRKWTISHELFHKKHDSFLSSRHSCSSIPMKPQFSEGISPWNQPFWWFISCVLWVNYGKLPSTDPVMNPRKSESTTMEPPWTQHFSWFPGQCCPADGPVADGAAGARRLRWGNFWDIH
jgi:hypothetical protein